MKPKTPLTFRKSATYPVAGLVTLFASAAAYATPPSTPNDLRADVYSSTAAEIFWSRSTDSDGFVRGYEITQDGEVVATFDGLSFFIDSLTEGVSTEFTVTAIDFDNERSQSATISVVGGGSSISSNSSTDRPTPPANLNAVVYSPTAAEVFWDRNTEQALSYEVSLDGVVVATTNGTSYFNGNLNPGQSTAVDVIAIDSNGQRSGAANVVFNTTGDTINPSQPQNPSNGTIASPANIRLEVYSGTAGELFWDRSSQVGVVETTLVRRDGIDLATTQGTSFFDDTRSPGVAYRYEVFFLAFDDTQSEATVFDENGNSQTPVASGDAPSAPANARIEVYSGTAAELFWDRAAANDNLSETRVLRDGTLIGTTQGNSFFDGGRVSGVEYRYELQSVNRDGVRSEVTVLDESTTPNAPTNSNDLPTDIARSTDLIFEILNGDVIEEMEAVRDLLSRAEELGFEFVSRSFNFDISDDIDLYSCPNGGTVGISFIQISQGGTRSSATADSCAYEDIVVSADFFRSTSPTLLRQDGSGVRDVRDRGFTVENYRLSRISTGNVTEVDEAFFRTRGQLEAGTQSEIKELTGLSRSVDGVNYSVESAQVTISDSTEPFSGFDDGISISIESLVGNDTINVNTNQLLQFEGGSFDPNPTAGIIDVAGQNATWQFDFDGGNPDEILITFDTQGSITSHLLPRSRFLIEYVDASSVSFER